MDLMSNMNSSSWQSIDASAVNDLKAYVVVRTKMVKPGTFEYHIREDTEDGSSFMAVIEGAAGKFNPLQSVRNVELKVEDGKIKVINLDGDCVTRK